MERRNNVHKYQTYYQALPVYLSDTAGQLLLLSKLVEQGYLFQLVSHKSVMNMTSLLGMIRLEKLFIY